MQPGDSEIPALPDGVRSRMVKNHNGLNMHILEAGYEDSNRPALVLLHGFPELAYSWRRNLVPLAAAGYHVIAPDQRGYGRTTGWNGDYDLDPMPFRTHNMARDILGLIYALGFDHVEAIIGHDFGSYIAAYCALVRPDAFRRLAMLSVPFEGAPKLPFNTATQQEKGLEAKNDIHAALAALSPPRKENMKYFGSRNANNDLLFCKQGVHDFMRAYYHVKSADWKKNQPYPLKSGNAAELAKLPFYYVMNLHQTMAEAVASEMPSQPEIDECKWLPESELTYYTKEFTRTSFKGALQWFRCQTGNIGKTEIELFSGRTIDVPSCFLSGVADWATYRKPGAIDGMRYTCRNLSQFDIVSDAGHWLQQEQPARVNDLLLRFLGQMEPA